jgi:Prenyltransferase and squalene oxidase repeat
MRGHSKIGLGLLLTAVGSLVVLAGLCAREGEPKKEEPKKEEAKTEAPAAPAKLKPLSASVKKGLAYLVSQQKDNGGWGQGGGWRSNDNGGGRIEGKEVADPPDVANTAIAALALVRAGNTPKGGEYAKNVARAVDFLCMKVEKSDKTSLYVTDVRGTQVQTKIGPYVDTFAALLALSELKGQMQDEKAEARLVAAMNKVIGKIEDNQQKDGGFAKNEGWASVLSQGLASKGLNRAVQNGFAVKGDTLARDGEQSAKGLDTKTGKFAAAGTLAAGGAAAPVPSDAGVAIYNASARAAGLQETFNSLKQQEAKARATLDDAKAPKEDKKKATEHLARLEKAEEAQTLAVKGVVAQVDDKNFIAGVGSNGGEEFLSYMNIGETLVVKGGKDWDKWDRAITDNLNRVQDKDGGWSGQHCITGRTFCTAAALLALMADRAPIPVVAKTPEKK